jgi:hypothetical protein
MTEDQYHELARLYMDQFKGLRPYSLDEFMLEYREDLTEEEEALGWHILELFNTF